MRLTEPMRYAAMMVTVAIVATACATGGVDRPTTGTVPITQVATDPPPGTFSTSGFYVDDGTGPQLCELLAESYPPQCAGAAVALDVGNVTLPALSSANGVTWSDRPLTIVGHMAGRLLVAETITR